MVGTRLHDLMQVKANSIYIVDPDLVCLQGRGWGRSYMVQAEE